ncbi:MAG TPA: hypothetical protein VG347_01545 [Verrucomicrobiae bacterium]|nr:hypothetical protein [Verrucomicrobiae bacterium]
MSNEDISAKWASLREQIDERNRQRLRDARATARVMEKIIVQGATSKAALPPDCDSPAVTDRGEM